MAFITPCFIRKNTPELRKKLEELGYFPSSKIWYDENFAICTIYRDNAGEYFTFKIDDDFERIIAPSYPYIDCGTNEDLFIALASMTDNEYGLCDYYIVTDEYKPQYEKGSIHRALPISSVIHPNCYRKATAEELIGHFKKE
jgi:hypothetical protein